MKISAVIYALLAAVFYAVNVPLSKILMEKIEPTFMAAFLYIGAGIGIGIMALFNHNKRKSQNFTRSDLPYIFGMIILDIAAPIFLMFGINTGSSSEASLLSNFETAATTIIAFLIFKESVSKKLWTAIFMITLSSIILSFETLESFNFSVGAIFVIAATLCWGLENNCTKNLSSKSTYKIVILKGIFSGLGSLLIAIMMRENFPDIENICFALLLGFFAYGLSIFMYIRAQKVLGASKTSAFYASAPFIGAFLSFVLIGEQLTLKYLLALFSMIVGTFLIISDIFAEKHSHLHTHMIIHTHDFKTHKHVIQHTHEHSHFLGHVFHKHRHTEQELLILNNS